MLFEGCAECEMKTEFGGVCEADITEVDELTQVRGEWRRRRRVQEELGCQHLSGEQEEGEQEQEPAEGQSVERKAWAQVANQGCLAD